MTNPDTHFTKENFAQEVAAEVVALLGGGGLASDVPDGDKLLSEVEAGKLLSVKPNTLSKWRHVGDGPAFVRVGIGAKRPGIRYFRSDLLAWARARRFRNTGSPIDCGDD